MTAAIEGGRVAAESVSQESRYPTDRGDTDASHIVDTAIGKVLLQQAHDLPAIDQCLQFSWRTQVFEKVTTFVRVLQAGHRSEKGIFVAFALTARVVSIGFHSLESTSNISVY